MERLLANLGYGKRRECQQFVQKGRAVRRDGKKLKVTRWPDTRGGRFFVHLWRTGAGVRPPL